MSLQNIKKMKADKGFTIVELLIVIVIIGILAAITIVAYNGIQNRGKTASAQSTAANVVKKAEMYNTDDTSAAGYPATLAVLTGAAATTTYAVPATSVTAVTSFSSSSVQNAVAFYKCGTGATTTAPTTAAGVTTQTGVRVDYYDFQSSQVKSITAGQTSGLVGTFNVGCGISNA
ncbi:putative major pilin subunit [compost metagenome]